MIPMEDGAERRTPEREQEIADRLPAKFAALARTADAVARALEMGADVHQQAAKHLPDAAEHADRARRFAAAERAAAAAYRRGEMPSDDVRRVIRNGGRNAADRDL